MIIEFFIRFYFVPYLGYNYLDIVVNGRLRGTVQTRPSPDTKAKRPNPEIVRLDP